MRAGSSLIFIHTWSPGNGRHAAGGWAVTSAQTEIWIVVKKIVWGVKSFPQWNVIQTQALSIFFQLRPTVPVRWIQALNFCLSFIRMDLRKCKFRCSTQWFLLFICQPQPSTWSGWVSDPQSTVYGSRRWRKVYPCFVVVDNWMELGAQHETRLTQKAMLNPTSMLLIKPIAAVVWRWSLIFHTTCSLLSFASLLFFYLHLVTTEKNHENIFPHEQNCLLSRARQHQIDYDFYRRIFSIWALAKIVRKRFLNKIASLSVAGR